MLFVSIKHNTSCSLHILAKSLPEEKKSILLQKLTLQSSDIVLMWYVQSYLIWSLANHAQIL